jgi:hypothetical protein
MPDFIAYYRVSTDRQGASGLGLEAQRAAVLRHIATSPLVAEYTEIEWQETHEPPAAIRVTLKGAAPRHSRRLLRLERLALFSFLYYSR